MAGVWTLLLWSVLTECSILFIMGSCPAGRFGDSCSYSCHCGQSCNQTTGVCGGDCDEGWVGGQGGTCQKENIAYKKPATSSGMFRTAWSADKAVDGYRDQDVFNNSCFHSLREPSVWTLDLGQQYRLHNVRIYNRNGFTDRIRNAVLSLSNSSNSTSGVPCYTFPNNTATGNSVYDVICDGRGRYFTVTHRTDWLNLCEVEIYVCSQGTFGADCNHFCHCSDAPCDSVSEICAGDCRPGWRGRNCSIECDQNHYGINCNNKCGNRKCAANTSSCDRYTGSCDTGCLPGWAAVDCTQKCNAGYYGVNCVNTCNDRKCSDVNSSCDRYTGSCDRGCLPGWIGVDCTQDCINGRYGQNCSDACSDRKCAGDSPCDHITGACVSGCAPGWIGEDCRGVCSNGSYGQNCNNSCTDRKCAGFSPCDHVRGTCVSGCEQGWMGEDCREEARVLQAAGYSAGHLAAAVAVSFVVGVIVCAVVCLAFWRRTNRRPHKTYESPPTNVSNARTDQSQNNDDTGLENGTYDSLQAESPHGVKMETETYCTITSCNRDSETRVSESVGAYTYENFHHKSCAMDGEIGKRN